MNDTGIISQSGSDDEKLLAEQLIPLVYNKLRNLAAARLAREVPGQTLQPTALVHEVWLRLTEDAGRTWENRVHFYRSAALAMRCILIDRARQKASHKRGGGWERQNIEELELSAAARGDRLLLINEGLQLLEQEHPESAEIVMLKFFSGLSNKETAETLGISESTVERRWAFAKVCLFQMIRDAETRDRA